MLESEKELQWQKRKKWITYGIIFVVFQVIVLTGMGLTVLRVRSPRIRISTATILSHNISSPWATSSPYFNLAILTEVTVKNRNFGDYKFNNGTMTLTYQGVTVGQAEIPKGKAKARKTRRLPIRVEVNSNLLSGNSNLANDINSGSLTLTSHTRLRGKATVMHLMKRKKSGEMNCTLVINTTSRTVQIQKCK